MQCRNHSEIPAVDRCAGCAEAFCPDCLVEIHGRKYCGSCKVMTVKYSPVYQEPNVPCAKANEALTYSIVGLFLCSIILGPVALSKANEASKEIKGDSRLAGSEKVLAARIIACLGIALWALTMFSRAGGKGS